MSFDLILENKSINFKVPHREQIINPCALQDNSQHIKILHMAMQTSQMVRQEYGQSNKTNVPICWWSTVQMWEKMYQDIKLKSNH